jgi:4-alpha-glucanotransferase
VVGVWPVELRDRDHYGLEDEIQFQCFEQFVFFRQRLALEERAKAMGILLFRDIPIFVAHDSADVWAHRKSFRLDDKGSPIVVSGVPPHGSSLIWRAEIPLQHIEFISKSSSRGPRNP